MKNNAIYMHGTNQMQWKEIPVPQVGDDEVLVRVDAVGICGSDMHYYQHGKIGDFVVTSDLILGHEAAGTIVQVGKNVKHLSVDHRVAMEPGVTCNKCEFCLSGRYHLCPEVEFFATPPYDGVLCNYVSHPASKCFILPDHVSTIEGALVEPLNVGLHTIKQGNVKLGDTVIIFGTGCIGLCSLLSAKAVGASTIIAVDMLDNRLQKAKELGATHTINASKENVVQSVLKITDQKLCDVVIETAGAESSFQGTVDVLKTGGTVVLVGMSPKDNISFNFMKLQSKEGTITTVFRYKNLYPTAISAIASGIVDIKSIVSHVFPFEETKSAFDFVGENMGEVTKAVITMNTNKGE